MKTILGISGFFHDSAATLVRDGDVVAAAQEERFSRKKGDPTFPERAIEYCLDEAKITVSEIDYVVFYENPNRKFDRLLAVWTSFAPAGFSSFAEAFPTWSGNRRRVARIIRGKLGESFSGKILYTEHHLSHAASAFFPSPFEKAAILTLDAVGEWSTSSIGTGEGNRITLLKEMRFPHSLGMLYSAFTYYTGFKVNSGEYKLMGLAPYGKPRYADLIREKIVRIHEDGSIRLDLSYFGYCRGNTITTHKFHALFGEEPRRGEETIRDVHMDLAASIQEVTDEIVGKSARHARDLTGMKHLVLAGGVALNCVANGRLLREKTFDDIWIQPAAGDAGGSLGAALVAWHHLLDGSRSTPLGTSTAASGSNPVRDAQRGSFLGPSFDDERIRASLDSAGAVYNQVTGEEELIDRTAALIAGGKIVGWFQGRMEFGPRALGARSIIGDARSPDMQQKMNLKIKYRESFRPFAPCVLRERVHDFFEMEEERDSPYMLLVAPVREERRTKLTKEEHVKLADPDLRVRVSVSRSEIPAVTHVDYSARIQTVDVERHGLYYRLIKRFEELTRCPVIVNTSFNIRGEPIVCTPENAYRCFMATEMDALVMGSFILLKEEQPTGLLPGIERYRELIASD